MAESYGFQYELVQYKWPRWLHQQTEKQRIIWGYKILFLDVLFPLAVDKIIFVDADQVNVRLNWHRKKFCVSGRGTSIRSGVKMGGHQFLTPVKHFQSSPSFTNVL